MKLNHLTDKQLLIETKFLVQEDNRITLQLLFHLKEIEKRKLYSDLGYPSLFKYIVVELGYTGGAAARRIKSFRLLKEVPEIKKNIVNGSLSLSNLSKAADLFSKENITDKEEKKEILKSIENTSARECDKKLSSFGKLDLEVRHLHVINISVSDETHEKFEKIRGLLAFERLTKEDIFARIFDIAIEHLEEKRFKTKTKATQQSSNTRYIPAGVKKTIYERDRVCSKCGSNYLLQIDHIKPYSLGGKTELNNLRLLCHSCNQRARIASNLHAP